MRPFNIFSRCQSKSLTEQYKYGIRVFDIRLRLYKDGFYVTHGIMRYAKWENAILEISYLCHRAEQDGKKLYFRFLLEYNREPKSKLRIRSLFLNEVNEFADMFPKHEVFGVRCKWDWGTIYSKVGLTLDDQYSSVRGSNWLSKLFPSIWAKKHNVEVLERGTALDCLMTDFI